MDKNEKDKIKKINAGENCGKDCKVCSKKATIYALINYVGLAFLKGFVGYFTGSKALIADAVHSSSDALTAIVGTIGMKIAGKPKDEAHPYGYGKVEFIIGLLVGVALFFVAFEIVLKSGTILFSGKQIKAPNAFSLIVPVIVIYANFIVSKLILCTANESRSPILKAIATDIRSDMYSMIPVIIALIGSQLGFPFLDPLGGVIVGFLIFKAAGGIIIENYHALVDSSVDDSTVKTIRQIIAVVPGIKSLKYVKTRKIGVKIEVDICIFLNKEKTVEEADTISSSVCSSIMGKMPDIVNDVQVFFNSA